MRSFYRKPAKLVKQGLFSRSLSRPSRGDQFITRISHVQQLHHPGGQIEDELLEQIATSQYAVAQAVLDHPGALVVQEEEDADVSLDDVLYHPNRYLAHDLFPSGFPENYSDMNYDQKKFLAKIEGTATLLYLGYLPKIYKAAAPAEARRINCGIAVGRIDLIFEARENLVISYCRQASLREGIQDVLLIYGLGHDFERRIRAWNDSAVVYGRTIPTVDEPDVQSALSENIEYPEDFSLVIPPEAKDEDPASLFQSFIPPIVKRLLNEKVTTLRELQSVYERSPWAIEVLLSRKNICNALRAGYITLDDLEGAQELQLRHFPDDCQGVAVQEKLTAIHSESSVGYSSGFRHTP